MSQSRARAVCVSTVPAVITATYVGLSREYALAQYSPPM